jgi:hypothetical protein
MRKIDGFMILVGFILTVGAVGGIEQNTTDFGTGILLAIIGLALFALGVARTNH